MENEPRPIESSQDWSKRVVSRRRLLAMAVGGAAATAVALAGGTKTVRAADGDPLIIGGANTGTSTTFLSGSTVSVDTAGRIAIEGRAAGYGLIGRATSDEGTGVAGIAEGVSGDGVIGVTNAPIGDWRGVYGQSNSTEGIGVLGEARLGEGGIGVKGVADAGSGSTTGVLGSSDSTSGIGVRGVV